jgi:2-polyprenyl-3-methyl-5-hydroxy-6-metoxy-1,4-benzoquinol methylase
MDTKIIASWGKNTAPWVTAVREGEIASRTLVTNRAIVDAVRSRAPASGIDIGCGEGWLVRALDGVSMIGVDVVPGLVEAAREAGGGDFRTMSYEEIAQGRLNLALDVAICNFSLLGDESVAGLFRAAPTYLKRGGTLIVQTMHPMAGAKAAGPASTRALPIRRPGTSARWRAGSPCSATTDCSCWSCASPCTLTPASRHP